MATITADSTTLGGDIWLGFRARWRIPTEDAVRHVSQGDRSAGRISHWCGPEERGSEPDHLTIFS
jgi:hypothetical protein